LRFIPRRRRNRLRETRARRRTRHFWKDTVGQRQNQVILSDVTAEHRSEKKQEKGKRVEVFRETRRANFDNLKFEQVD